MGVTDNKMKVLGNYLRVNCGRNSVDKLKDHMIERNKKLVDHFTFKNVEQTEYVTIAEDEDVDKKKKRKKEIQKVDIPVVFAKDVEDLASLIMTERGLTPETSLVQVGIDDGQGLLKVMLSIKEKNDDVLEVKARKQSMTTGLPPKISNSPV